MRAVIQRVASAAVRVGDEETGRIGAGLCVLLGVGRTDGARDAEYLSRKTLDLRIFEDEGGKFARSVRDVSGEILVVSQFTLYADCRKGRRPSFSDAASPEQAEALYEAYVQALRSGGVRVATGRFQARMALHLVNEGPVTIVLESVGRP